MSLGKLSIALVVSVVPSKFEHHIGSRNQRRAEKTDRPFVVFAELDMEQSLHWTTKIKERQQLIALTKLSKKIDIWSSSTNLIWSQLTALGAEFGNSNLQQPREK